MSATNTLDVFSKMLKIQLVATLAVAIVMFFISGLNASVSAMLGGASVLVGAAMAAIIAKRSANTEDASAILDRKSTRLNSSHGMSSRMPSSA